MPTNEPTHGVTFREMCEVIARAHLVKNKDGSFPTAEQIYNYSPQGELSMIYELYQSAKEVLQTQTAKLN